jgi:hypothetical protein
MSHDFTQAKRLLKWVTGILEYWNIDKKEMKKRGANRYWILCFHYSTIPLFHYSIVPLFPIGRQAGIIPVHFGQAWE